jgi:thymidine phosphorylase
MARSWRYRSLTPSGCTAAEHHSRGGQGDITSDAHAGLVAALGATLPGASWQRCRTHYAANLMSVTPQGQLAVGQDDAALGL